MAIEDKDHAAPKKGMDTPQKKKIIKVLEGCIDS